MKKKILIIKPPYAHVPVGMAYVLGCLESAQIPFDFFDMHRPGGKSLEDILLQSDYFAVATGGLVTGFADIFDIVEQSKRILSKIPFILGGNITQNLTPQKLFDWLPIDYAVLGEAETALPQLLRVIYPGEGEFNDLNGIIYKHSKTGEIVVKAPLQLDLSLEDPLPAYHHIDIDYYLETYDHLTFGKMRAMPVLTGRGCKGKCTFCSPTLGHFRARDIDCVIKEIKTYNTRYNPDAFFFLTEVMFKTASQISIFCSKYRELPFIKPWMALLRPEIDPTVLPEMKAAGCIGLNVGVESGSDRILRKMRKGTKVAQIVKFLRAAREVGIITEASAMLASEGETAKELASTIDLFIDEDILHRTLQLVVAYPGTAIYDHAVKRGLITDERDYLRHIDLAFVNPINAFPYTKTTNVNISDIPQDIFWPTLYGQFRRYTTYLYKRCSAMDIRREIDHQTGRVAISGKCPLCGYGLAGSGMLYDDFLEISTKCPICKIDVFFNIYAFEDLKAHANRLNRLLVNAERPVIVGKNKNTHALFLYGMLKVPFERLLGVVGPRTDIRRHWYYFPILTMKEMCALAPDVILNVESGQMETPTTLTDTKVAYLLLESMPVKTEKTEASFDSKF